MNRSSLKSNTTQRLIHETRALACLTSVTFRQTGAPRGHQICETISTSNRASATMPYAFLQVAFSMESGAWTVAMKTGTVSLHGAIA